MNFKDVLGLGIAGNFALHLDQAGEAEDFKDVKVDDENAPKGIFPFYLPNTSKGTLSEYPLSSEIQALHDVDENIQAEPELALLCEMSYMDTKVVGIKPTHFGAYNDCSIRRKGAKKISEKKNWGMHTKGLSEHLIALDKFEEGGMLDKWRISSFLRRNGDVYRYGEDVEVSGYSYFYKELLDWIQDKINTQEESGPLEDIASYLKECDYPKKMLISIGATRYTSYGEKTFLQKGDEVYVVLYDNDKYCKNPILCKVVADKLDEEGISYLHQKVH
ncbi:hypothetical protein JHD50_02770 [Sulfurimonas sp. MAG313]|nr:DUF5718 family protein [Sulfurimonas sp. MAG313]MDF1880234.1 hypothetical protein [Sulfurimonas sp. MAG313]